MIGDGCVLGARITITAHQYVELGDSVFTGQSVFITDASHGYQDPEMPIGQQFGAHQPVVIGSGTWIGHGVVILPGSRIGRNVVVAAGAVVAARSRTTPSWPAARPASYAASSRASAGSGPAVTCGRCSASCPSRGARGRLTVTGSTSVTGVLLVSPEHR